MPKKKIRIGFKISEEEREQLETLLRMIRLLEPKETGDNEWRRTAFWYMMTNYLEWMPTAVVELAEKEPVILKERMAELEKKKGRKLSPTGQLQAIRRWRAELSEQAQELMAKAKLVDAIEATPIEEKPVELPPGAIKRKPEKEKPIDIEAVVSKVIKDYIDNQNPNGNGTVTRDLIVLKASILTLWKAQGYLMRIHDEHGQKCWAWIEGDYDLAFPDSLTVEDIESFDDLTAEESGERDD
jgi:hypothetical protein